MSVRPNFLIIGAQKAGSAWLSRNLNYHPQIFTYRDEIHYFNLRENFDKGIDWYESHFSAVTPEHLAVGEKTPNYLWLTQDEIVTPFGTHLPNVHQRIYSELPDAKLIVIVRDPIRRAVSAINHYMRGGQLSPLHNIDEYIIGEQRSLAERYGVLAMGKYYAAISAYLSNYTREQLLVLEFQRDIVESPASCLETVCEFLGVDPLSDSPILNDKVNAFHYRSKAIAQGAHTFPHHRILLNRIERKVPASLRNVILGPAVPKQEPSEAAIASLRQYYAEPNSRLFEILDKEFSHWS